MNLFKAKQVAMIATSLALSIAAVGCAKQPTANVSLSSPAFNTSGPAARIALDPSSSALSIVNPDAFLLAAVTEFKFCVKRVKLEGEDGQPIKKDGETGDAGEKDPDDIRFAPGLIDVTAGVAKDWGSVEIPVDFKLKEIKVKVKKDESLCGVPYSVTFNGQTTDQDIEFKWKFNPSLDVSGATKALSLSLSSVVAALRSAADAGALASMKDYIEGSEGTAQEQN